MQLFFSRVSAEFEFVDYYFHANFGHLPQFRLVTQGKIADQLSGWHTLDKLYDELQKSQVVVHLIGAQLGARPKRADDVFGFLNRQPLVQSWLHKHDLDPEHWSYTQWEGMLAACLQDHDPALQLYLARPANPPVTSAEDWQHQQAHERRLRVVSRYVDLVASGDLKRWVQLLFNHLRQHTQLIAHARQCLHKQSIRDDLKGRDVALDDLAARLPSGQTAQVAILSGAGRGKTCLAVEYAYRNQARYHSLLLVRCDHDGVLAASLAGLARCLKLASTDSTDAKAEQLARDWLRDAPGWLLIVDNIDDVQGRNAALTLLQDLGQGHTLITSRYRAWPNSVTSYDIRELSPEAAASLLLAPTSDGQAQGSMLEAQALAEDLGRVPNVLVQARAYINARNLSIATYHQRWRDDSRRAHLLREHDEAVCGYPKCASDTWLTTWNALSTPARTLLNIWSCLTSAPIHQDDLVRLDGVAAELPTHDAIEKASAELRRYSLVQSLEGGMLAMHPIDQLITRDYQQSQRSVGSTDEALQETPDPERQAWQWLYATLASDAAIELPRNYLLHERRWRPHAEQLLARAKSPPLAERLTLLAQLANYARARADFAVATVWLNRADALIASHEQAADCMPERSRLNDVRASVALDQAKASDAWQAIQSGLAIVDQEIARNPDSISWQRQLANYQDLLGNFALSKNQLDDANAAFVQAEAIRRVLAERAPDNEVYRRDWSVSLNNLGSVAQAKNQFDDAKAAFAQAAAIRRALSERAPDSDVYRRDWSISLSYLGRVAESMNQLDDANAAFVQVEAIRSALAESAPDNDVYRRDWSVSLDHLGRVAKRKNQLDEAKAAFAQAEAIFRALAERAPDNDVYRHDWSISLENLGRIAESKNQLNDANAAFVRAEAIRRSLAERAPDNDAYRRDWAISLHNLARACIEPDEALTWSESGAARMRELLANQPGEHHWHEELIRFYLLPLVARARRADKNDRAQEVILEIETRVEAMARAGQSTFAEEIRVWLRENREP